MIDVDVARCLRELPVRDLHSIVDETGVVILAPHPDDESLGCGGLIAAACERERAVHVIFITDGTGSHPNSQEYPPARLRCVRENEAVAALGILGLARAHITFLRLPDTAAPHDGAGFAAAVDTIAGIMSRTGCGTVLGPWRHDPHCDHLAAHLMAEAVAERLGVRHLAYPVWGWTVPLPDAHPRGARLEIRRFLRMKRRAIAAHESQHGRVVTDDPGGFVLPPAMLKIFDDPFEVFLDVR